MVTGRTLLQSRRPSAGLCRLLHLGQTTSLKYTKWAAPLCLKSGARLAPKPVYGSSYSKPASTAGPSTHVAEGAQTNKLNGISEPWISLHHLSPSVLGYMNTSSQKSLDKNLILSDIEMSVLSVGSWKSLQARTAQVLTIKSIAEMRKQGGVAVFPKGSL